MRACTCILSRIRILIGVCLLAFAGCHNRGARQLFPLAPFVSLHDREKLVFSACESCPTCLQKCTKLSTPVAMPCTTNMGRRLLVNTYSSETLLLLLDPDKCCKRDLR